MRIFSGIQPTGRKHLGNYIGAIRQWVEGQDRGDPAIYCIVDLHAITVAYDPAELRRAVYDTTAMLIAAGLDPSRCILFRQGDVHEHTELCWLLTAVTLLVPFLALGAVAIGGVLISRDRVGPGVAIIVISLMFAALRVALALS